MPNVPNFDGPEDEQVNVKKADRLESLPEQLRNIWVEEVRRFHLRTSGRAYAYKPGPRLDGGTDSYGMVFKPIWPKLADFIFNNKLNPLYFVRSQFDSCKGKPPLNPSMIMNDKALNRYQIYRGNREVAHELRISKDSQVRHAKDAVALKKLLYGPGIAAYRAVILDDNIPLSALFRYVLSVQCNDKEMMDIWFDHALMQYQDDVQAYDEAWGDLIPTELRNKVLGEANGRQGCISRYTIGSTAGE